MPPIINNIYFNHGQSFKFNLNNQILISSYSIVHPIVINKQKDSLINQCSSIKVYINTLIQINLGDHITQNTSQQYFCVKKLALYNYYFYLR